MCVVRPEFANSRVRSWSVGKLRKAYATCSRRSSKRKSNNKRRKKVNFDVFVKLFELELRQAARQFRLFCERSSVRDLSKAKRRGNVRIIFSAYCLILKSASVEEKATFLFDMFDERGVGALSARNLLHLITSVQKSLDTLDRFPDISYTVDYERVVNESFQECGMQPKTGELSPYTFLMWAASQASKPYLASVLFQPSSLYASSNEQLEEVPFISPSEAPGAPRSSSNVPEISAEGSESSTSTASRCGGRSAPHNPGGSDASQPIMGFRAAGEPSPMPRAAESAVPIIKSSDDSDEDEEDEIDAASAVAQVIECVAEIEQGDTSGLEWFMQTVGVLCADYSDVISLSMKHILPTVCNVAACANPALAREGMSILHCILLRCGSLVFLECADVASPQLIAEILLVRSCDDDQEVSLYASRALEVYAKSMPFGFGTTMMSLLDVGCLHPNLTVAYTCATSAAQTVETRIASASEGSPLSADLEGAAETLFKALVIWAHGEVPHLVQAAKLIVLKLGIHFDGDRDWEDAIDAAGSPILKAWNDGREPDQEEFDKVHQSSKQVPSPIFNAENSVPPVNVSAIVPAGRFAATARRCALSCTMYPQVFAILGFRGLGGRAVGISPRTDFDTAGSWRKREIVTESKITEYKRVMPDGTVQVWTKEEKNVKDITRVESRGGDFAHREYICLEQSERLDGEKLKESKQSKDFVHLKNDRNEFSGYVDASNSCQDGARVPEAGDRETRVCRTYSVDEPETPRLENV